MIQYHYGPDLKYLQIRHMLYDPISKTCEGVREITNILRKPPYNYKYFTPSKDSCYIDIPEVAFPYIQKYIYEQHPEILI